MVNVRRHGGTKNKYVREFNVTAQKVRLEFIRKDFIKGLRLNSERL